MTGPRNRAPLGQKTTNAKAKAFQTPGDNALGKSIVQGKDKTQLQSASRRPKTKLSQSEALKKDVLANMDDAEVPDIEYMPPKPVGTFPHPQHPHILETAQKLTTQRPYRTPRFPRRRLPPRHQPRPPTRREPNKGLVRPLRLPSRRRRAHRP